MPKILIPTALRPYAANQDTVELDGQTVGELLSALTRNNQELRRHLYTDGGQLRSFVNIYINDENIRHLDREATRVAPGDTISIIPSVAGGSVLVETQPATEGLSNQEILRYSRHLIIPEVGMEGQIKLKQAKVLLIGAGGLGAPLGLYLTAVGVGRIGLVDFDVVDLTNLQRQVIHGTSDVGRKKLDSATEAMTDINPGVRIDRFDTALSSENALEILRDYDVIVDGTDNFPTRYLVNDACVLLGKPNVYGSIFRFEGQATVFAYQGGPCYRCLYPEPPPPGLVPSCAEGGVLGILPGLIGLVQATETVKLILGIGQPLAGRLLLYDALAMRFRELIVRRDPECPICGDHPSIRELVDYHQFCGVPRHLTPQTGPAELQMDVTELKAKMDKHEHYVLIDVREPSEYQICRLPGSRLMPLRELPRRVSELDSADDIIVHCKSGARSMKAVEFLTKAGFRKVRNLRGGILAWSDRIDPSVPKY
jgi:adenylyltransferase/sulfurtransferase